MCASLRGKRTRVSGPIHLLHSKEVNHHVHTLLCDKVSYISGDDYKICSNKIKIGEVFHSESVVETVNTPRNQSSGGRTMSTNSGYSRISTLESLTALAPIVQTNHYNKK